MTARCKIVKDEMEFIDAWSLVYLANNGDSLYAQGFSPIGVGVCGYVKAKEDLKRMKNLGLSFPIRVVGDPDTAEMWLEKV